MKRALVTLLVGLSCAHAPRGGDDAATLQVGERTFTLAQLRAAVATETVSGFDPYYQREKAFLALPLLPVLRLAYGDDDISAREFVMRASDGYTVPISGARLMEGAYLAFADADGPWEPIGAKHANPGPWYLVWKSQTDLTTHPRPWALASVRAEAFETVFPRVVPPGDDAQVKQGFALFRAYCVKCHAVNQQGGTVGPELNVPMNITEYRDEAFLRAWISDPSRYRVSVMPPSPQLSDDDLTAVLAYLRAMKSVKVLPTTTAH